MTQAIPDSNSFSQIFPNADLCLLKQCVSVRDKLLQKKYDEHKVQFFLPHAVTGVWLSLD